MPDTIIGRTGGPAEVDDVTYALRVGLRPLPYGTLGHYRATHSCVLAAAQAANSRVFELRNTGSNLIVPTRLRIQAIQTAAGTAQENAIDVFKVTSFSVTDTTNIVTPTATAARTTGMTAAPGGVALRGVTVTGAAAGMTGGTLTKAGGPLTSLPLLVSATASPSTYFIDAFQDTALEHPLVLGPNEGIIIENRVLNAVSYGFSLYIEMGWAELAAY